MLDPSQQDEAADILNGHDNPEDKHAIALGMLTETRSETPTPVVQPEDPMMTLIRKL